MSQLIGGIPADSRGFRPFIKAFGAIVYRRPRTAGLLLLRSSRDLRIFIGIVAALALTLTLTGKTPALARFAALILALILPRSLMSMTLALNLVLSLVLTLNLVLSLVLSLMLALLRRLNAAGLPVLALTHGFAGGPIALIGRPGPLIAASALVKTLTLALTALPSLIALTTLTALTHGAALLLLRRPLSLGGCRRPLSLWCGLAARLSGRGEATVAWAGASLLVGGKAPSRGLCFLGADAVAGLPASGGGNRLGPGCYGPGAVKAAGGTLTAAGCRRPAVADINISISIGIDVGGAAGSAGLRLPLIKPLFSQSGAIL